VLSLLELMERFDPVFLRALLLFVTQGGRAEAVFGLGRFVGDPEAIKEGLRESSPNPQMNEVLRQTAETFREEGFVQSAAMLDRIIGESDRAKQFELLTHLQMRLEDELATIIFVRVPGERASYFEQGNLFGEKVAAEFVAAQHDITEAGNCYAVGVHTATVFHLMRVMEVAIKFIGSNLGIPDPVKEADRNWWKMLDNIRKELDRRNKLADNDWLTKRPLYDDVYTQLCAVRTAWRNPVMHVDAKHDSSDATRIMHAVKDFMGLLADGPK